MSNEIFSGATSDTQINPTLAELLSSENYAIVNGVRVNVREKAPIYTTFSTDLPRITPAIFGFRAAKGRTYTIPFSANNLALSELSIKADTSYFSSLQVFKVDEHSGYIKLASNLSSSDNKSSVITVTDQVSGISTSIVVTHSILIASLANTSVKISENMIAATWKRDDIVSNSADNYGLLEPRFTLSADIKFKVYYVRDYFNQASIYKTGSSYVEFKPIIMLEQPFTGNLTIRFEDLIQGAGGEIIVPVDYRG